MAQTIARLSSARQRSFALATQYLDQHIFYRSHQKQTVVFLASCRPMASGCYPRWTKEGIYSGIHRMFCTSATWHTASSKKIGVRHADRIKSVVVDDSRTFLDVLWSNKRKSRYPVVFLRDNCRCTLCDEVRSKPLVGVNFEPNVTLSKSELFENGQMLKILWDDGHSYVFDVDFLCKHEFPASSNDIHPRTLCKTPRQFWDASSQGNIPKSFPMDGVLSDDATLYSWLETLAVTGVAIISDAATELGEVEKLGKLLHGIRNSPYGSVIALKSKNDPNSLAYTGNYLPLHSDLPYYNHQPGIVALHCIAQSKHGGANLLVDGWGLAKKMKIDHPEDYDILTKVKFSYAIIGTDVHGDYHFELDRPIIQMSVKPTYANNVITDIEHGAVIKWSAKFEPKMMLKT